MKINEILLNKKLEEYYSLVIEYNKVMNLTSITEKNEFYDKHFYDSLFIDEIYDFQNKVIMDLGSGAGFPGIPLAICHPEAKFYLVEPIKKRCNFLTLVKEKLGLNNVYVINKRSEDLDETFNEKFDLILSRAVAKLNILVEISVKFLKINGILIFSKGLNYQGEINEAKNALGILKLKYEKTIKAYLPFSNETRFYIIIKKLGKTPSNYPRRFSLIKKKPL